MPVKRDYKKTAWNKPKKRRKHSPLVRLGKKLDKAWSLAIRSRAKNKCEVCGKAGNNPHHYISRGNRVLRWELRNGICTCAGCHLFNNQSFHKNPEWGHFWMEENRWEDLQYIVANMYETKKWTEEEMQEKLKELEAFNDNINE